jgi:hypothetical protein
VKFLITLVIVFLVGCSGKPLPTYAELKQYPLSCKLKAQQLVELERIQNAKRFAEDPDQLNESDRAYNSLLREHLWWFVYNCEQ